MIFDFIDTTYNLKNAFHENKVLFVFFFIVYYLLPGVLYYLYVLYAKPKSKEKWYVYFFYWGNGRFRIGFAILSAFLTLMALRVETGRY